MSKNQKIHKARGLESEFVILRNHDAQRKDLSYEALGMLVCLMSRPDDWEVYVTELQRERAGRDKVSRILNELKAKGYLHVSQQKDEDGKFTTNTYDAYAYPGLNPHFEPSTENPSTGFPNTANPQLQSKDLNKGKKEQSVASGSDASPEPDDSKKDEPPEKERDILFDGIAALGYKIPAEQLTDAQIADLKKSAPRIAQAKKFLLSVNPALETMTNDEVRVELKAFWKWLRDKMKREHDLELTELRDARKWSEYYTEYHYQHLSGEPAKPKVKFYQADYAVDKSNRAKGLGDKS